MLIIVKMKSVFLTLILCFIGVLPCAAEQAPATSIDSARVNASVINFYYSKLLAETYVSLLKSTYEAEDGTYKGNSLNKELYLSAKFKYQVAQHNTSALHAAVTLLYDQNHRIQPEKMTEVSMIGNDTIKSYKDFCSAAESALNVDFSSTPYSTPYRTVSGTITIDDVTRLTVYDIAFAIRNNFMSDAFIKEIVKKVSSGQLSADAGASALQGFFNSLLNSKDTKIDTFKKWFELCSWNDWNTITPVTKTVKS